MIDEEQNELQNKLPFTVCIDFDGVIHNAEYPLIGELAIFCKKALDFLREEGCTLILSTCRAEEEISSIIYYCIAHGLRIDYYNENDPKRIETFGNDSRKIGADAYVDDKNMPGGFTNWLFVGVDLLIAKRASDWKHLLSQKDDTFSENSSLVYDYGCRIEDDTKIIGNGFYLKISRGTEQITRVIIHPCQQNNLSYVAKKIGEFTALRDYGSVEKWR